MHCKGLGDDRPRPPERRRTVRVCVTLGQRDRPGVLPDLSFLKIRSTPAWENVHLNFPLKQ